MDCSNWNASAFLAQGSLWSYPACRSYPQAGLWDSHWKIASEVGRAFCGTGFLLCSTSQYWAAVCGGLGISPLIGRPIPGACCQCQFHCLYPGWENCLSSLGRNFFVGFFGIFKTYLSVKLNVSSSRDLIRWFFQNLPYGLWPALFFQKVLIWNRGVIW